MDSKMISINKAFYTVITREEYFANRSIYDGAATAIDMGNGLILPVISKTSKSTGIYPISKNSLIDLVNYPENNFLDSYSVNNMYDLGNSKNLRELMKTQECIRDIERDILVNTENVFTPKIGKNDTAEMKGFKQAVINKGIDKDNYAPRLGPNAANDLRLFKEEEITLKKMKKIAKAFDMKVSITYEDASPNVPNPMGDPITVVITGEE